MRNLELLKKDSVSCSCWSHDHLRSPCIQIISYCRKFTDTTLCLWINKYVT